VPRTNPTYPPEFRREAVRLIRASDQEHPIPGISVCDGTLRNLRWTRTRATPASEKGSPPRRSILPSAFLRQLVVRSNVSMPGNNGMLQKGLSLLEALGGYPDGVGVTRVAKDVALPVSTSHRLLNDLVASGFASFDPETRSYYLGLKVFELSSRVSLTKDLSDVALPVMRRLSGEIGESVFMGVREGADVLLVEKVVGPGRIQVNDNIGSRIPLHRLAQGKSILAFLPEDEREELINQMTLEPETPRTITDPGKLRHELDITRERGWASVDGENEEWVRAIATPIMDERNRPVAALAIAAPAFRVPMRELKERAPTLLDAVREIEVQLPPSSALLSNI
jgi:IclR family transcriptional regulator, acetate operon repressor